MAFKMKGSPYAAGRHATKQTKTMAYQVHSHPGAKEPHDPMKKHNPPLHMKSPLNQYEKLEGYTYGDETIDPNYEGPGTGYMIEGEMPGTSGGRSGDPGRSAAFRDAVSKGLDEFTYKGKTYTTQRSSDPKTDVQRRVEMPDTEAITLDPIMPELSQEINMEPEKPKLNQKQFNRMMKKRKIKQDKERKQNRLIPRIGRGIRDIDLIPGDPKSRRKKRRKIAKKIGRTFKKLNPKNWGGSGQIGCPGV